LHQRAGGHSFSPAVTLLKPLKGCEPSTEECLRSWFAQEYTGRVQILLGVASADDPVCQSVRKLQQEFPNSDAQLIVCGPLSGANAKVSTLIELERLAKHELLIISDADVRVPADFLAQVVEPLREAAPAGDIKNERAGPRACGLVTCFYRLANPATMAMQWEAVAINADFWSQVLQSESLRPLDFALGAVMATRRRHVEEMGGFASLVDYLADDYQIGNRIARQGYRIALSTVAVECWSAPMNWGAVWKHQLRWARTIRVCQPAPYFFSILSNATLWPWLWVATKPSLVSLLFVVLSSGARIAITLDLQSRLMGRPFTIRHSRFTISPWWLVPIKDLLQVALWVLAFAGNRIEWRGQRMRLRHDGRLERIT
jgi:ceramide glucosyltransferase